MIYGEISLDREDDESARILLQQRLLRVHRLRLGHGRGRRVLAGLQRRVVGGDLLVGREAVPGLGLVLLVGQVQLGDDVGERHDGDFGLDRLGTRELGLEFGIGIGVSAWGMLWISDQFRRCVLKFDSALLSRSALVLNSLPAPAVNLTLRPDSTARGADDKSLLAAAFVAANDLAREFRLREGWTGIEGRRARARSGQPGPAPLTSTVQRSRAGTLMMRGSRAFSCNLFRTKKGKMNVLFNLKYGFSTWGWGIETGPTGPTLL